MLLKTLTVLFQHEKYWMERKISVQTVFLIVYCRRRKVTTSYSNFKTRHYRDIFADNCALLFVNSIRGSGNVVRSSR